MRPIRCRKLVRDRPEVVADRLLADPQDLPDLAIRATASHMREDLELPVCDGSGWRSGTSNARRRREPARACTVVEIGGRARLGDWARGNWSSMTTGPGARGLRVQRDVVKASLRRSNIQAGEIDLKGLTGDATRSSPL